jgi:hypothetical protein
MSSQAIWVWVTGGLGALLVSPFNVKWRCSLLAGGVEGSKFCLFSVVLPARCVSSVSPRFHYRRHAFCFLPLATILGSPPQTAHIIFDKGAEDIQWRKNSLFNKCCWKKWLPVCKKLKLDPCFSSCNSINSKWIKEVNTRPKILKLVQESAENNLEATGIGKNFLNRIPAT